MHISQHADQRMNQRGISRRLIEFTLRFGRLEGDKRVLDRNESRRLIESLTEQLRLAKRIMDKGGVVVVDGESDTVVTTYNIDAPMYRRKAAVRSCVADAEASLSNAFKALSSEALKSNNQNFLQLATASLEKFQEKAKGDLEARQKAVDSLVQPIRESLVKVDGKLGEMEKTRESAYSALNEQLRGLIETHLPVLRSETSNLVKALRQPTVRGRWGEIQLRRVIVVCDQRSEDR